MSLASHDVAHAAGSVVVVRTVTAGRIRWASAAIAVRDNDEFLAFYQSNRGANKVTAGAAARWPDRRARELALRAELLRGEFELVDKVPAKGRPTLTVAHRHDWFSVRFARDETGWQPEYVNVCLPFRRSAVGFDTDDLCLDVVVHRGADGSFNTEFKDDDDLDERAGLGIYPVELVARIRAAGREAVERIRSRAAPFDGSWTTWTPEPAWPESMQLPAMWADDV